MPIQKFQKRSNGVKILAIESSCDDSGIAILENNDKDSQPKILANLISSQVKVHVKWGGVVPMLAKREHQRNLLPLLKRALHKSKLLKNSKSETLESKQIQNLKFKTQTLRKILEREPELLKKLLPFLEKYRKPNVDYIAVTVGPGLEPALWVGVNLARALSYCWNLPLLPINHIEGHLTAAFCPVVASGAKQSRTITAAHGIAASPLDKLGAPRNDIFPAIALVVSGGHTQLILIKKIGEYEIIGETRDDAAGEAFDKVAKMLGLGYPGGQIISQLASLAESRRAEKWQSKTKNYKLKTINFYFPRPMINSGDFDFSFSGLKTAVLYTLQKMTKTQIKKATPAIAAAFQQAVVDVLVRKTINSAREYQTKSIWLAGGVAANQALRQNLEEEAQKNNFRFLVPPSAYCADNAGMIALAAFYQFKQSRAKKISWQNLKAEPNLRLS